MISNNKPFKGEENHIFWKIERQGSNLIVTISAYRSEKPVLHWGIGGEKSGLWQSPPKAIWPPKTRDMRDGQAVQTYMIKRGENQFFISITIPYDSKISRIYFVLYFPESDHWDNNHQQDYSIPVRPQFSFPVFFKPNNQRTLLILDKILDRENRKHWEMGMRLEFIQELLTGSTPDESVLSLLEVYLQYAAQGSLPWRKYYDRQTYILAPKIQELALKISRQISLYPRFYAVWRRMLKNLPSSGRNLYDIGLAIRVQILKCKDHQNRHIYDTFLYEFHQKLHNASGPEDIAIAEAYLAFLDSKGDLDQFYQTLLHAGLAKQEKRREQEIFVSLLDQYGDFRSIQSLPSYDESKAENTIKVIYELLQLLKKFYGGIEIEEWVEKIRGEIDRDLQQQLRELIDKKRDQENRFSFSGSFNILNQLSDLRNQIHQSVKNSSEEQIRDFVLFDITLENYAMAVTHSLLNILMNQKESADTFSDSLSLLQVLLSHLHPSGLSVPETPNIQKQLRIWRERKNSDMDWYLQGKAVIDHLNRIIQTQVMEWVALYQPRAEALGRSLEIEERVWQIFTEENVRASWLFLFSRLITFIQGILRRVAGWPANEVLVSGKVQGMVTRQKDLASLSCSSDTRPRIVLLERLRGDEDIPQGIVGIITPVSRDRMSHFGIRAREQGVVWIYLDEKLEYQKIQSHEGKCIELIADEEHFQYTSLENSDSFNLIKKNERKKIQLPKVHPVESFILLSPNHYELATVGPKAYQLRLLKERLFNEIQVPASLTVPFGVFDLILQDNSPKARDYQTLLTELKKTSEDKVFDILKELRLLIGSLDIPGDYLLALEETIPKRLGSSPLILRSSSNAEDLKGYSGAGLYESYGGVSLSKLSQFLKKVWASKWTDRAVSNRLKVKIPHDSVHLAVIVQQLIKADYAFVVHTRHPLNRKKHEIYIEVVQGLGEALVDGSEGQGYRFVYDTLTNSVRRVGYANKGYRWLVDDNGRVKKVLTDYSEDIFAGRKSLWGPLVLSIAETSLLIESAWENKPQDIEGVIKEKALYIVQTRPQIF